MTRGDRGPYPGQGPLPLGLRYVRPIAAVAQTLADVLITPGCAGCGTAGSWLCVACRDGCEPEVLRASRSLTIVGAGTYAGPLREAIHKLKYGDEPALANEIGALVAARVAADLARGAVIDVVIPIPLHRARARDRGYDQAALLTGVVAERIGLPEVSALHRIRGSRPQVGLRRDERLENVSGAFVAEAGALRGLRVALIDDVATTGATCLAAAAAARSAGARDVRAYVAAVDA